MANVTGEVNVSDLIAGWSVILCLFKIENAIIATDIKSTAKEDIATEQPYILGGGKLKLVTAVDGSYTVELPVMKTDEVTIELTKMQYETGTARNLKFWMCNLGTGDNRAGTATLTNFSPMFDASGFMKISFTLEHQGIPPKMTTTDYTTIYNLPIVKKNMIKPNLTLSKSERDEEFKKDVEFLVKAGLLVEEEEETTEEV